ncbi:rod shape-determining protein MreC [Halanaerobium salsuginis]|uniref:Cell shape-determining protein MreC n=1 Tax=Halanaerobium salsuginis TaxID=29563 RepID=A0A1I4HQL6_9FIRM|nr:rod shape-determining protein MreC [Halanaerobium salsuginis]SFL44050.1 rod shape-determining protein MreC [Halanaerobium salsuginis]
MFKFNRNSLLIFLLFLLIISGLFFFQLNSINLPFLNWLRELFYNLITPVLNLINNVLDKIKGFFITLFSIDDIQEEVKQLRRKNNTLERQILFLENINRENERLRELLNFKENVDYQLVGAKVIANSPSIWEKVITVNRGSNDGVEKRMPVITYRGYLVGRVEAVGTNSAQVRLLTDKDFVVGGIVARTDSRAIGLLHGSGRKDQSNIMDNIAWDADITKGDIILTSGLSNNFPAGIKIGQVQKVEADNYGLSQKADIGLFINSLTLEEVMIIKNFPQAAEDIPAPDSEENSEANSGQSQEE